MFINRGKRLLGKYGRMFMERRIVRISSLTAYEVFVLKMTVQLQIHSSREKRNTEVHETKKKMNGLATFVVRS